MSKKRPVLLHVNIPFCVKPCKWQPECAGACVMPGWDLQRQNAYMEALQREISANAEAFEAAECGAPHNLEAEKALFAFAQRLK